VLYAVQYSKGICLSFVVFC